MAQPYVGELRMFAGNFAPAGWQFCDGSLLPISENETLFQLIGTTYGGDGQSTFAVPDLRGRVPVHMGTGPGLSTRIIGETGGAESITLTVTQMPAHTHPMLASANTANTTSPQNAVLARTASNVYTTANPPTSNGNMASALSPVGGSQPHENMQPYLAVSFIISLFGIFPSPT
jgi:microcystin-dependent protein